MSLARRTSSVLSAAVAALLVAGTVGAVTTISTNVVTDGNLTIGGTSSLQGTVTIADGVLLDLSAILHDDTANQGVILPQAASASPSSPTSGEGYLAWDTAGNQLIAYNGSSWATVGGSAAGADGAVQFASGGSFAADASNLFWDDAADRLGIGTASPLALLDLHETTDAASNQVAIFRGNDRATPAANDEAYFSFDLENSGGTQTELSRLTWVATDVTAGSEDGLIRFSNLEGGALTANALVIDGSNVGIGALSPGAVVPASSASTSGFDSEIHNDTNLLEIRAESTGGDSGVFMRRSDDATGVDLWSDNSSGEVYFDNRWDDVGGTITFRTRTDGTPVEAMTIDGDGNVGIGTNSPSEMLEIEGTAIGWEGAILTRDSGAIPFWIANNDDKDAFPDAADRLAIGQSSTLGTNEYFTVTSEGKVGVGAPSPASLFEVKGTGGVLQGLSVSNSIRTSFLYFEDDTGTADFFITRGNTGGVDIAIDANGDIALGAGGSNGSVGIGADAPGERLEVDGGVRLNTSTGKPTCDASARGTFWVTQGGAGVKDDVEVCAKDAGDAYDWRTIY